VAIRRGARNAQPVSDLPQRQCANAFFLNQIQTAFDDRGAKISMMIGRFALPRHKDIFAESVDNVNIIRL
jgi:hypothetical protein